LKTTTKIKQKRREVEVVVISDVHLGTYGCHAKELCQYLKSIQPGRLILNGDIVDMWQFSKNYFPKDHMQVVKEIISLATKGVPVHYITGNHDELLRKFSGFQLGNLSIDNKLVLEMDGKRAWVFHGDVFDVTMQHAKWLTKLGAIGYDLLILINACTNSILKKMGKEKISLSKKIKNGVKSAVKYINNFEVICADIAISNGYDYVVCGHIHQPEIRTIKNEHGEVGYLNSGDWVENLTALEYHENKWSLYHHPAQAQFENDPDQEAVDNFVYLNNKELFNILLGEIYSSNNESSTKIIKKNENTLCHTGHG
jgi:UDP-2,3-diacylglucosamine pyrophosphatase LpxH